MKELARTQIIKKVASLYLFHAPYYHNTLGQEIGQEPKAEEEVKANKSTNEDSISGKTDEGMIWMKILECKSENSSKFLAFIKTTKSENVDSNEISQSLSRSHDSADNSNSSINNDEEENKGWYLMSLVFSFHLYSIFRICH